MSRNRRAYQKKIVQGPQVYNNPPKTSEVITQANLVEKYLGTNLIGGFGPTLEVLSNKTADELIAKHGYALYRKMMMDAEVKASVDVLVQSPNSQPVTIVPNTKLSIDSSEYKKSLEYAYFCNDVFETLNLDEWRKQQTRVMLAFGNAVSEIDWEYRGNRFVISRLRQQLPENYGFIVDRWGEVYGVVPLNLASGYTYPLGNIVNLPADKTKLLKGVVPRFKLSIWQWEIVGTDPRGTSILIPAYIPWWSKQRALEEWSLWISRYAQPSIWATPGPDALPLCITMPDGSQKVTQPTELLLEALLNFKSASVLALPYGSVVHLLQANGGVEPFINSITLFNKEITRGILSQHLASSEGDNQSRAAAEVHAMVLRQNINTIRRLISTRIKQDLVKPLIESNFGDVGYLMPEVDLGDGDGWAPTVNEIAVLMQAGYFSTDQLPKIDRILGLPVRETNEPAGPAAAQAYYSNDTKQINS